MANSKKIDTDDLVEIEPEYIERYEDLNGDYAVEAGDIAVFYTGDLQAKITVPDGKRLIVTQRVGFRMIDA